MKARRIKLVCLAAASMLVVAACSSDSKTSSDDSTTSTGSTTAPAPPVTGTPLVIGSVGTYTFPQDPSQDAVARPAIEAWAQWVNTHGGINGHPVKLIVKDNKNDQALAVSLVKELVEKDHVAAFVSNQDGSLNAGYADYLKEKGIPVLGGNVFTLDPWITNPMFFPEGITALQQLNAIVDSAKNSGVKKLGAIGCAEAAQCGAAISLLKSVSAKAGVDFAYGATVSSTAPDYTATCLAAKSAGADALVLLLATSDTSTQFAEDCSRQSYEPSYIIPGEAIASGYLDSPSFNNAVNNAPVQPWFSTDKSMDDFHSAMALYAKSVDFDKASEPLTAVDAWVSGLMLQKAVELSGATGVPKTADILAGLAKFKDESLGGLAGNLNYSDPTNKLEYCYFTIQIKDKKFTTPNGPTPPKCVKPD
jgi:branched-chain amino acid transport system substrate-binding protein